MDYALLKNEILNGPLAGEFVDKSDDEIAAILNSPRYPMIQSRFVTARTLLAELTNGAALLDKLTAIATQVSAVKWAMKFLESEGGIDIGHPSTQAQIDALVTGKALTIAEGEELKSLAITNVSRAEIVGLENVSYDGVSLAREII